jgi:hypothetical protein
VTGRASGPTNGLKVPEEPIAWTPEWVEWGWMRYRRFMLRMEYEGGTLWDLEGRLLDEVGTLLSERRGIFLDELQQVAAWRRMRRVKLELVDEDFLLAASKVAFWQNTPNHLRHLILMLVKGVGLQLASAVMKLYDRFNFAIIDPNIKRSLQVLGRWQGQLSPGEVAWDDPSGYGYFGFVRTCLQFASDLGVDLCSLERALWQWAEDCKRQRRILMLDQWRQLS